MVRSILLDLDLLSSLGRDDEVFSFWDRLMEGMVNLEMGGSSSVGLPCDWTPVCPFGSPRL